MESEDKRLWCAAFGGGVLVSYDGGISWGSCGGGPENGMVLSLAWSPGIKFSMPELTRAESLCAGRTDRGSGVPEGGGKGVSVTAIEPFRDGVVFGTASGGLYYAEAGRSFVRPLLPSDPVAGLAELESGAVTALSRSGRLYRSDDRGVTWKEIELP